MSEARSRHLSIRLRPSLHERLTRMARTDSRESRSGLAARLIDEGLRVESHPGIVFRSGPAGRRPGLVSGPDVWEVARILRDVETTGERAITDVAALAGLDKHRVRAVAGYYDEFRAEVDAWIDEVDQQADEALARTTA